MLLSIVFWAKAHTLEKAIQATENWAISLSNELSLTHPKESEWILEQSHLISTLDLGDHAPLSEQITQIYRIAEMVLGRSFMEENHYRDIWVMNYAIPVATKPAENWGEDEYIKHFKPMSEATGYWISFGGCHLQNQFPKEGCKTLAKTVRKTAGSVAPLMGKLIYRRAHKND